MRPSSVEHFRELGYVVLRGEIDPVAIAAEMDRAFLDGFRAEHRAVTLEQGTGTVTFQYLPMMCERTPVSLRLLDQLSEVAAKLVGRPVLPGRAKGTRYVGDTGWHRDSEHDIASVGCIAYLEPLVSSNGALRVWPGSQLDHQQALLTLLDRPGARCESLETVPGDVIIFDEHLVHGSAGGDDRRQWRVDFVVDPDSEDERASVLAWFGQSVPDEKHDPGYDTDRYPSYGSHWRARERPWTRRLRELGVY